MNTESKSPFGPKPELGWLRVERLSVDQRYQRSMETRRSERLIDAIAGEFNWFLFGTLIVVRGLVNDTFLIIDGQHRCKGAKRRGVVEVPTALFPSITLAQQARAFVDANRLRVAVSPYAIFHAQLAAGDPAARTIADICTEAGVAVPRAPGAAQFLKPGETLALGAIKSLIAAHGGAVAVATLKTLCDAMPEPGAMRAHYINALGNLVRSRTDLSLPKLKDAIAAEGFDALEKAVLTEVIERGTTRITAAETQFLRLAGLEAKAVESPARLAPGAHDSLKTTASVVGGNTAHRAAVPARVAMAAQFKPAAPRVISPAQDVAASEETDADLFTKPLQRRCLCGAVFKTRRANEVTCPDCTRAALLARNKKGAAE